MSPFLKTLETALTTLEKRVFLAGTGMAVDVLVVVEFDGPSTEVETKEEECEKVIK